MATDTMEDSNSKTADYRGVSPQQTWSGSGKSGMSLTRRGRLMFIGLPAMFAAATFLVALFIASSSALNHAQASLQQAPGVDTHKVQVAEGDTLWSIALEAPSEQDIQSVMTQIAELNGLDSSELELGQLLYVPRD